VPPSLCTDTELACSELLQAGKRTGIVVTGAVLEAAVEWKNYRIVFVTDDIPFFPIQAECIENSSFPGDSGWKASRSLKR
jgi:hypothetical protein